MAFSKSYPKERCLPFSSLSTSISKVITHQQRLFINLKKQKLKKKGKKKESRKLHEFDFPVNGTLPFIHFWSHEKKKKNNRGRNFPVPRN